MKKVIAAVVFMLLVAVFAPFGASDVCFCKRRQNDAAEKSYRQRA